jgi:predicted  nucleic acid-binding Zn-ribbon protein
MTEPAPGGTVASPGQYRCTNCGHVIGIASPQSLPPCPNCAGPGIAQGWEPVTDGDPDRDYDAT